MTLAKNLWFLCLLMLLAAGGRAENPIIPGYADPHMKIWDGKMYLSVGKDKGPEVTAFTMPYWSIFSSTDLVNWTLEYTIDPATNFMGAGSVRCWATDIDRKNGKYYFYFSNGGEETGVMRADHPNGPYVDILKKPMLAGEMSVNHEYDPTIFTDDDGTKYIIFGRDGQLGADLIHYQIARLGDDMMSLAEPPRDLMTTLPYGFGASNRARDHQYFHKYNGTYYLSCAGAYMTSKNIVGPFSNMRQTGQNGHSSFCEYNGQWYHSYEWTCEPYGNRQYRQVNLTYLHYKDNGDMISDPHFLQKTAVAEEGIHYKTGVGNYGADWDKIEAEWFFAKTGALKKECPLGGFEIQGIQNGNVLNFPNVKGIAPNSVIHFNLSSKNAAGGTIEVHKNSPDGPLLGQCAIPDTGSWKTYRRVPCNLTDADENTNLFFVFKGEGSDLLHLDWFNFENRNAVALSNY